MADKSNVRWFEWKNKCLYLILYKDDKQLFRDECHFIRIHKIDQCHLSIKKKLP
ncbi:hypothetical protein HMPREF9151_01870 [Hoylesella saccharolytica F0055]|uniref:Uncharacterized protein n=1 Tax=Hoylesella saccharolytica F0055 TaxID=1127699 RepID=L1N5W8_9BACT|nr:hypothetical protein HMPREF9151_01870 [Hoylesella saccharolytica F0055]